MRYNPIFHTFLALLAVGLVVVGCSSTPPPPTLTPTPQWVTKIDPPKPMTDFTLTNHTGQPAHLSNLAGKLTLITFGYTHCPDICPVNLAHFKQIKEGLGAASSQVNFVFVSVDGKRDTPERLAQYLSLFDASFIGLTGDEAAVRQVITEYSGQFNVLDAMGLRKNYVVEHSVSSYLLNQQGQWIRTYAYNTQPELIVGDIEAVLDA